MLLTRVSTGIARLCLVVLLGLALSAPPASAQGGAQMIYGLIQGTNNVVRFSSAAPAQIINMFLVTGLVPGDTLKSIDFRPATGGLYAIAVDGSNTQVRTYLIDTTTFAATAVGAASLPTAGTLWGISFNPVVDRIRIVNDQDENARLNPEGGVLAGDDTNLTPGTVTVDSVAYTNQFPGATSTTLYALNQATNSLATIGGIGGTPSPNGGAVTDIGPLGVTFTGARTAFDIAANGVAFAALTPNGGGQSLYTMDLATGTATLVGLIGDGAVTVDSIAVVDPTLSLSPGHGTYTTRQRFDLVLLVKPEGRSILTGTATFDGFDVTGILASCIVPGTNPAGIVTFRCPNLGGPVVGPGEHTLQVRLILSDGTPIQSSVKWLVVPVAEVGGGQ